MWVLRLRVIHGSMNAVNEKIQESVSSHALEEEQEKWPPVQTSEHFPSRALKVPEAFTGRGPS